MRRNAAMILALTALAGVASPEGFEAIPTPQKKKKNPRRLTKPRPAPKARPSKNLKTALAQAEMQLATAQTPGGQRKARRKVAAIQAQLGRYRD